MRRSRNIFLGMGEGGVSRDITVCWEGGGGSEAYFGILLCKFRKFEFSNTPPPFCMDLRMLAIKFFYVKKYHGYS